VQKIIGEKVVTDRQQTTDRQQATDRQQNDNRQPTTDNRQQTTDNRQTDIFELTPIHMGNFIFFFAYGRERRNGMKFIPPCLLRKLALLTCFALRWIKINLSNETTFWGEKQTHM
jgi:hypothetical protein